MRVRTRLRILCGSVTPVFLAFLISTACGAQVLGTAQGNLAMICTDDEAFGYSTYTCHWSSVALTGTVIQRLTSASLGVVITDDVIYAFNPISGSWFSADYEGVACGWDLAGAVAVFWSNRGCYAISTIWTTWAQMPLREPELVRSGGSAGSFAVLWSGRYAWAYNGSTGTWLAQRTAAPIIGGIATDGLGFVWTSKDAMVFEPNPGGWIGLPTTDTLEGMSTAGSGDVALVWSATQAFCYSGALESWTDIKTQILGGSAGGHVAVVWNLYEAHSFDANTGHWATIQIGTPSGLTEEDDPPASEETPDAFLVAPNPSRNTDLVFHLPAGSAWEIEVIDVTGRLVHTLSAPASERAQAPAWNWTDDAGRPVAAGTYWVRARSAGQAESRRVVRLP